MASLLSAIPGLPSTPGIGEIAAGLPGAPAGLSAGLPGAPAPTVGPAPTSMPLQPSQMTPMQQFMAGGMRMEKFTLILLTLFPPTALAGLNLQALGNTTGALLKAGSYLVSSLWALRLMKLYPGIITSALGAVLFLGPWFLFDCIEILLNPEFSKQGFRPPLAIPGYPGPTPTDGSWILTPTLVGIISALLPSYALGITGILNQFAPGLVPGDTQKYIGYMAGGAATLGAGFALFSATKAPTAQMGGGSTNKPLPPLSSFAKELMQSSSPKAFQESLLFLGLLGVIITGGIALSMARNALVKD